MFDNIIGEQNLINQLKNDITQNLVPPSMLFVGDFASAKLSTALEFARVVSCLKNKEWACDCSSCVANRQMVNPYVVMIGTRYFKLEIEISSETFLANPKNMASYFLYLRAIRKLLRRFDTNFLDDDSASYKKAKPLLGPIEELLDDIKLDNQDDKTFEKKISSINSKALELAEIIENKEIGIAQIRNLNNWAKSNAQNMKVVIIENADLMSISACNALLKTLEEPPSRLYFILIAKQQSSIMETILSRVRVYQFEKRSVAEEKQVIEKIFKANGDNLKKFFIKNSDINIKDYVIKFYEGRENRSDFRECYDAKKLDYYADIFWTELVSYLQELLASGKIDFYKVDRELNLIKNIVDQNRTLNQNNTTLAELFFYSK